MVFNVNFGFQSLENKKSEDSKGKKYSLFIADTVLVNDVKNIFRFSHRVVN